MLDGMISSAPGRCGFRTTEALSAYEFHKFLLLRWKALYRCMFRWDEIQHNCLEPKKLDIFYNTIRNLKWRKYLRFVECVNAIATFQIP